MTRGRTIPSIPVVPILPSIETEAVASNPTTILLVTRSTIPLTIETRTTTNALRITVVTPLLTDIRTLRIEFGVVPCPIPTIQGSVLIQMGTILPNLIGNTVARWNTKGLTRLTAAAIPRLPITNDHDDAPKLIPNMRTPIGEEGFVTIRETGTIPTLTTTTPMKTRTLLSLTTSGVNRTTPPITLRCDLVLQLGARHALHTMSWTTKISDALPTIIASEILPSCPIRTRSAID